MWFLPNNYEAPETGNEFYKLKKWKNKFRVVSECLVGYEHWSEEEVNWEIKKKPNRTEKPTGEENEKHFRAFCVYDYEEERIKILVVTQKSIQENIANILQIEWKEDITKYDLYVNRTGDWLETKYTVSNWDTEQELSDEIKEATNLAWKVDLDILYKWGYPIAESIKSDEVEEF